MPLPWLIGAAVVAAAAAVIKAVSDDDDSTSSSDTEDDVRREQEREAKRQHKRDSLIAQLTTLEKDRLAEARELLALSAETLAQLPRKTVELNKSDFESALNTKSKSVFEYAGILCALIKPAKYSQEKTSQRERDELMINLQMLESLYGPIPFGNEEQRDLAVLREAGSRLDKLQNLKLLLEHQG